MEQLIAQRTSKAVSTCPQPPSRHPPPPPKSFTHPLPPRQLPQYATAQHSSTHQHAPPPASNQLPSPSTNFLTGRSPAHQPAPPPPHLWDPAAASPARPPPTSRPSFLSSAASSSSHARRTAPSPSKPPWLNASSSASAFYPLAPPPAHPSSSYLFTRRSEVAATAAAAKADKAAAPRSRRRSQRPSARQQTRKLQEESPFLDKQLSAFVLRELEMKEEEWTGRREVDGGRFVYLHNLPDRTGEVGHSSFCDVYVRAVQQLQEGKMVSREQRSYIGAGGNGRKVEAGRKRKSRNKADADGGGSRLDDAAGGEGDSQQRRRLRRLRQARDEEEDEDAPLHPQRSAAASSKEKVAPMDDEDVEELKGDAGEAQPTTDVEDLPIARDGLHIPHVGQPPQLADRAIADFFQQPARVRRAAVGEAAIWLDEDEPVVGSLPALTPSPPTPTLSVSISIVRAPSPAPLVDFPLESPPLLPPSAEVDRSGSDSLVRHLAGFVLQGHAADDALSLPSNVLFVPQPSSIPTLALTPPQPPSTRLPPASFPSAAGAAMTALAVSPAPAPWTQSRRLLLESGASTAQPTPAPSSAAAVALSPSRAAAPSKPTCGDSAARSAAERRALAEEKRQRWLLQQQEKQQVSGRGAPQLQPLSSPPAQPPLPLQPAAVIDSPQSALPTTLRMDDSWTRALHQGRTAWRYPVA